MDSTLTKLALTALALLFVIGLLAAIGFAWAAYQSWVRKTRGPEEADSRASGEVCSSCVVSDTERASCAARVNKDGK